MVPVQAEISFDISNFPAGNSAKVGLQDWHRLEDSLMSVMHGRWAEDVQRKGKDLKPQKLLPGGKFDLNQWNVESSTRFANCLDLRGELPAITATTVVSFPRFSTCRRIAAWAYELIDLTTRMRCVSPALALQ